jgi:hypothetical protein
MSFVTRTTIVIGACAAVIAATAGCDAAATSTAPADPTSGAPSPSSAADACANPQVSSVTSPVRQLALTASALPTGGPPVEQISDGEMNNTVNSDQRGFANVGNTYRIEDDVVLDPSAVTAAADYPQLRDAAQKQFTSVTSTSAPAHLGCEADEFIGKTASGFSQVGVAFQEGDVIAIVLVVNSTAAVNPEFAEAVALAQDQKIVGATA